MKRIFKALHRENRGFTLVELLIVFALMAVLAAIVVPNVGGFVNFGQTQGAAAELSIVQTAVDSMMAKDGLTSVNVTAATDNMQDFPDDQGLYPNYLRFAASKGTYSVTATGLVTQATTGY